LVVATDHIDTLALLDSLPIFIDLPVVQSRTNGPAPHALGGYGILPDEPVGHIDIVDMLFQDMVSTDPIEVVPISHLIFQFTLFRSEEHTSELQSRENLVCRLL